MLLVYEVANALRYKPDLSVEDVCTAVQSLYDLDLGFVRVDAGLSRHAVLLAKQYNVTVYDAIFLACAEQIAGALITADEAFFHRVNDHPSVFYLGDMALSAAA